MNIFKAAYCRAFQFVFKCALPFLPYREPQILHSLAEIPAVIIKEGKKKPLIVADKGVLSCGLVDTLFAALGGEGLGYALFDGVIANPTTDCAESAARTYKECACDCIIGFGGGSSMDCAKAAGARIARPDKSFAKMKGILKVRKKIPLLFAVPTTAGTGSETTLAAVVVDGDARCKYAINDFPLIPRYAVLDPAVTFSLPPFITATTGLDALTHAVEAYIGRSTTKKTREEALEAAKLIFENLPRAYEDGKDGQARANMLKAAYLAGCAFTKSYVGYVHAVAHSLGGEYDVPHGLANAILLPRVLKDYGKKAAKKLKKLAVYCSFCAPETPAPAAAEIFISRIEKLKEQFGIKDSVPALVRKDVPRLAGYADREANPLYPVPKLYSAKQLEKFYFDLIKSTEENAV